MPLSTGTYRASIPTALAAVSISSNEGWSAPSPSGRLQMMARKPAALIAARSSAVI